MYIVFFHLLWLSLLEIIFYFEYIGPLETQTYQKTINRLIDNKLINQNFLNYRNMNITEYIHIYKKENNEDYSKQRNEFNESLYIKSIKYWFILFSFVLFLYFIILIYKYYKFIKNKEINNLQEVQLIDVQNNILNNDIERQTITSSTDSDENIDVSFFNLKKLKKFF